MRKKGCKEDDLFSFLSAKKDLDLSYASILSSMCTPPHPVAVKAHTLFENRSPTKDVTDCDMLGRRGRPGIFWSCGSKAEEHTNRALG